MKRYIKSFKIIFIAFVFISLFYSLEMSKFKENKLKVIEENDFFSYDSIAFHIDSTSITQKDLIQILKGYNNVLIQNKYIQYSGFNGSAIYFNSNPKYKPNIIEGRYFNLEDFNVDTPIAVVGKSIFNNLTVENGEKYLMLDNIKYKVIGVMGGNSSFVNNRFIINLNSYDMNNNVINKETFYQLEITDRNKNIIDNLIYDSKNIDTSAKILKDSSLSIVNPINGYIKSRMYYIMFVMIAFIISTINITSFYMLKRKNEIGVLKAIGIKNIRIFFKIFLQYEIVILSSFSVGLLSHWILYIVRYKENIYYYIDIFNILLILSIVLITGFITCSIPLIKLLKISPTEIIKR